MSTSKYVFPHTDFNYIYKNYENASKITEDTIEGLLALHERESRSVPFYLKEDEKDILDGLPNNWGTTIMTENNIAPTEIRIVVYNLYWNAERLINIINIAPILTCKPIGANFMIIDDISILESEYEESSKFMELIKAEGYSPIKILVIPGASFNKNYRLFDGNTTSELIKYLGGLS